MVMSVESIRRVEDKNTYLLLIEPTFYIEGKEFLILSSQELKNKRVANTAGVDRNDLLSEGAVLNRTVSQIVNIIKREVDFTLHNIKDAKLIFTIIDTFLIAQARLLELRLGGLTDWMIDDFENLTKLANVMLSYIDISDRIDLMNAPIKEEKYTSVFDFMLGNLGDSNVTHIAEHTKEVDEGYVSPFSSIIRTRKHLNRIDRFN